MVQDRDNIGCCIIALIAIGIILYVAGNILYGLGRQEGRREGYYQGQEDKVSRAACMKYMVFDDVKWRGK